MHFNRDIARQFFRLEVGDTRSVTLQRVEAGGRIAETTARQLVYAESNKNPKIEFAFPGVTSYPTTGRPLLVIVEVDAYTFRYRPLLPGQSGHAEMLHLTEIRPSVGSGVPRVLVTLDDVEMVWTGSGLRGRT